MSKYHKKKRVVVQQDINLTNQGTDMADDIKQDVVDTTVNQDQIVTSETQVDNTQEVQNTSNTETESESTNQPSVETTDTVIKTDVADDTSSEVVNTDAQVSNQPEEQNTQQQPTDQPAIVDMSAVVNNTTNPTSSTTTDSSSPEIMDTKEQNLTDFEKFEQQVLNEGIEHEKNLIIGLREYLEYMKPKKPVDVQEGLLKQRQLLEHIKGVLRIEDKNHFKRCWKLLIKYFHHHSKHGHAFHETYINRFTEHWSTGPDQLNAFRNLTHLLKETAQQGASNVHRTVNIDTITKSKYFKEEERQKILDFYNT